MSTGDRTEQWPLAFLLYQVKEWMHSLQFIICLYPVGSDKFIFTLILVENVEEEKRKTGSAWIEDFKISL